MTASRTVLMPLPRRDYDPTEAAVAWQVLVDRGHRVHFATPDGAPGYADDIMVTGRGLDPWGLLPGLSRLTVIGRILRADANARAAYSAMLASSEHQHPTPWDRASLDDIDGLYLPGGHRARGMREYLESQQLQHIVAAAFAEQRPVAAICHGVLLAARSNDPATGRSVLHGKRTTSLTWALERRGWQVGRVARFWDRGYYRTYDEQPGQPAGFMSVQQEVTRALKDPQDFIDVDPRMPDAKLKNSGRARDRVDDERPAFVVRDGNYVSARWPGDAHTLAQRFAEALELT